MRRCTAIAFIPYLPWYVGALCSASSVSFVAELVALPSGCAVLYYSCAEAKPGCLYSSPMMSRYVSLFNASATVTRCVPATWMPADEYSHRLLVNCVICEPSCSSLCVQSTMFRRDKLMLCAPIQSRPLALFPCCLLLPWRISTCPMLCTCCVAPAALPIS